jgi:hypothetical protein
LTDHIENRDKILRALREELVGPSPQGEEIDCSQPISFQQPADSYGPWRQKGSGEEILQRDPPCKRYGVGVLYPAATSSEGEDVAGIGLESSGDESGTGATEPEGADAFRTPLTADAQRDLQEVERRGGSVFDDPDPDDFDLSAANEYKPGSMGVSFLAEFPEGAVLRVEAAGGRYRRKAVQVAGQERIWWLRSPVTIACEFPASSFSALREARVQDGSCVKHNCDDLGLNVEVFSRPYGGGKRLVTVCLVNRKHSPGILDQLCLFQAFFEASVVTADGEAHILPYPGPAHEEQDDEEKSLALLYRHAQTFATGHGCSADWSSAGEGRASSVSAESLPVAETPSITPEVRREDGTPVEVPMAPLAGLVDGEDGLDSLSEVVSLYEAWIGEQHSRISSLKAEYREAAGRHLDECSRSAGRMREGLNYLRTDARAMKAFQLANHAILLQQIRTGGEPREAQFDLQAERISFTGGYPSPDPLNPGTNRGNWRPFQVAFLLASIRSAADGNAPDRRTVELIWFPTGGGKTEAYLGLAAFSLFMRRLADPADSGVHVLMRYTLRLLTAQQFQRASGLLCAMEHLRRQNPAELGTEKFSIGIWVGGSTTPNTRQEAKRILSSLKSDAQFTENKFALTRCPWCRAQMGPVSLKAGRRKKPLRQVLGYEQQQHTVILKCPDNRCEFKTGLPVYVVDEDIYEERPSLVIGTVDKFARLAWLARARALFGIGADGERAQAPPGLIIQDELHLISGPLGSMVGLYETVIEELCTDRRGPHPVPPKIVSSTATIRRYGEQIKALYGREDAALFPPSGLDAADSFFARYAREEDGSLRRGRVYTGVHASALGSLQTAQVRTFAALLQAPVPLTEPERDPWWTMLAFFNSLRELGTTLSLFQSDIPDRLKVLRNRLGLDYAQLRDLWRIRELTGRLRSEEVPEAIAALEAKCGSDQGKPVDVCLASNIIEVGIDIDRLSLMTVVGQPKTTSQYIQVTGRVGRRWWERPGLIATVYSASKPRDRSHFEKFRSYHERLYAQVEPTSVTPFSPPALDRALHAVMVSYAQQQGGPDVVSSPDPYPEDLMDQLQDILMARVRVVDPAEEENFERVFAKRAAEWRRWQRTDWTERKDGDIPLLRVAGAYASRERELVSWATPMSMRNVDAECEAEITRLYLNEGSGADS